MLSYSLLSSNIYVDAFSMLMYLFLWALLLIRPSENTNKFSFSFKFALKGIYCTLTAGDYTQ